MGKKRDYNQVLAREDFLVKTQGAVRDLMHVHNISQKNLADLLGCTEGRVSQLLSDNTPNLTLKKVAEIFYVLNEEPHLLSKGLMALRLQDEDQWNEKYRRENSILSKLGLSVDSRQSARRKQDERKGSKDNSLEKRPFTKETFEAVAVASSVKIEWNFASNDNQKESLKGKRSRRLKQIHVC